jgi:hypothetical protein
MSAPKLISQADLRELREELFKLERATLRQLIDRGIDPGHIALTADISRTTKAIEQLQPPTRGR